MTLRDAANDLANQREPVFVRDPLPDISKTAGREAEIAQKFGLGGPLREPPDLGEIQARLITYLSANRVGEIGRRDLRYAPQCLWYKDEPIADRPEFLERLLQVIEKAGRRSIIRTLAAVYFRYFRERGSGIELVGNALSRMVGEELDNLYRLHQEFHVFDPAEGPIRIARYCLNSETTPINFLRSFGLSGEALTSGFGVSVFSSGMSQIADRLSQNASVRLVERANLWIDEPKPARYRGSGITLANTLLLPFRSVDPTEDIRNRILDIVLERIGDPRTRPDRWQNMPDAAEIAHRWLTRLALLQFLDIVDQVAYPRQWDFRRAFWTALYNKKAISKAWVAFGQLGAERARRDYGENIKFGRLVSSWKPVESGHAVLVMRIGDYIVIDWSQNGRCVVWPADHPAAPELYRTEYLSGDLAPRIAPEGGIEVTHSSSDSFAWQRKVAEFLRRNTGYDLRDRDFRVS